jgi:predicted HTH transcriptional regulator
MTTIQYGQPLVENGYCTLKESITFESKKCSDKLPKSFWETYSSFANTLGGTIVLRFAEEEDRLKLVGIQNPDKIIKELWDLLHDHNKVSANILTEDDVLIEDHQGLKYIVVKIPRADRHQRPIYVNGDLDNGTYRRNNEGDYHCTVPDILEMGRDASDNAADQRILDDTDIADINMGTLSSYRNHLRSNNPTHPWLKESDEEFLRLIGAANLDRSRFHLTQAGLLMFGNDYRITRTIPDYHLDYRRYTDNYDEWDDRINSDSGLWSGNLFDFYLEVSNRLIQAANHPFKLKNDRRIDNTELMKAEREMVLNGIVHADHLGKGGINIVLRNESLTVNNPGNFRIPPSKAALGGYSDARNPLLMKMFTLVGFVERSGSGIYRIFHTCRLEGLPNPEVSEEFDPSRVTFVLGLRKGNDLRSTIIMMMKEDDKISIDDMASKTGISKSTISREISRLKKEGIVSRIGGTKGHWRVE